jgi:hypothetical protein
MITSDSSKANSFNERTPTVKTISTIARADLIGRTGLVFLLALLHGVAPVAVAQGGKAEPLRVQFKPGSTRATLRGTVRGEEEFEYAVAARAGQWMFVEVTAAPSDSAMFMVTDPVGEDQSYHYSWSGVLKQTGDYLISVSKPPAYGISRFTLTVTIDSRSPELKNQARDADSLALFAAMRKFIDALRRRNTTAFLSLFSRRRPSYHLNPMNVGSKEHFRDSISYTRLALDVRKKQDLYWLYIARGDNGNYDAFVDHLPDGRMWLRVKGNKFVPPGAEISSHTYVRWRKEGGRWVVHEISYATA